MPQHTHPLLLGHRGARNYAPENTRQAFELSLEHGCDGFEFDVRACGDGDIVCHDPQLRGMQVASSVFAQLATDGTCSLADVIQEFSARAFLDVELKVSGLEPTTVGLLASADMARGYVVSSFLPEVVREIQRLDSTVNTGWICDEPRLLQHWRELARQYFIPHHSLVSPGLVDEVHSSGKKLLVWTVNDPGQMQRLAALGVDGIISDDTELLCRTLKFG